jgi:hypothetical protein
MSESCEGAGVSIYSFPCFERTIPPIGADVSFLANVAIQLLRFFRVDILVSKCHV